MNKYKHCKIERSTLIEMYRTSLSSLNNLSILSINFSYIADGTGKTLLSVGSILEGKLKTLKILCMEQEIPSRVSMLYSSEAYHIIPDYIWSKILKHCPSLKVHMFFSKYVYSYFIDQNYYQQNENFKFGKSIKL